MPKRVIDFDAMWGSDKLAACAEWAQAEYAWLYGLADASGCFELTNLRVIWGRVAAIRHNLTIERLEEIFAEFRDKGLLFVWEHEGKQYGHWTGSDVPGRLPPPSWRMRLERFAPPVPKQQLAEYTARFSRGRAALASAGFLSAEPDASARSERKEPERPYQNFEFEFSDSGTKQSALSGEKEPRQTARNEFAGRRDHDGLKAGVEAPPAQDLDWNENGNGNWERNARAAQNSNQLSTVWHCQNEAAHPECKELKSDSDRISSNSNADASSNSAGQAAASPTANCNAVFGHAAPTHSYGSVNRRADIRALQLERELRVGQGPVCAAGVKPEVLERIRKREAARAGSRSP